MITMNSKAQLTVEIIAKIAEYKMTIANATKLLNKSRQPSSVIYSGTVSSVSNLSFMAVPGMSR